MSLRLKKPKTILLTLLTFGLVIFIVLNVMVIQLNSTAGSKNDIVVFPQERKTFLKDFDDKETYKVQIQRKPKTANFDDLEDDNMNQPQRNHLHLRPNGKENSGIKRQEYYQKHNKDTEFKHVLNEDDFDRVRMQDLKMSQQIEDMEDIGEDYDEDEDDDDDLEEEDDDYDYDDTNEEQERIQQSKLKTNPVFKPGDFGDIKGLEYYRKPKLKYENVPGQTKIKPTEAPSLIEDGIYWSSHVESLIPKGLSYSNVTKLIRAIRETPVASLQPPAWNRCGRAKNAFVTLADKSSMCARYRHPHSSFVFGEVLSFYLSRLLGMDNIPVVVLARTNSSSPQWKATDFSAFEWENNITVALIQWINNLESRSSPKIPKLILEAYRTGQPMREAEVTKSALERNSSSHIPEIVQWGSMITFDYLTGNYDRVASMQDAADKERKPSIIEEPIRNLRKSSADGKLWLVDNESGLFDAYELLKPNQDHSTTRFSTFHRQMLQTMCVFQAHVVRALKKLYQALSPHERLVNFALSLEPLLKYLPKQEEYYKLFTEIFVKRIEDVLNWVNRCQSYSYKNR